MKENRIEFWAEMQKQSKLCCPRCGQHRMNADVFRNSLSRIADIYICNNCGMDEALYAAGLIKTTVPLNEWYINKTDEAKALTGLDFVEFVMEKKFSLTAEEAKQLISNVFSLTQNDADYPFRLLSNSAFCDVEHLFMGGTLLFAQKDTKELFGKGENVGLEVYKFRFEGFCNAINRMLSEGLLDACVEQDEFFPDRITYDMANIALQYSLFGGFYRGRKV